jgi:hypothetical protein
LFLGLGFLGFGWPGWAASAARVGTIGVGVESFSLAAGALSLSAWQLTAVGLLVLIWLSYQVTPVMYNVVERVQVLLVSTAVFVAVVLFVLVGSLGELAGVPAGIAAIGTVPPTVDVALLLGAIAFAGAGGYLNLSQSLWVREKGYGMGRYQGRIKNPIVGDEPEPVQRDGFTFPPTVANLRRWRGWWRLVQAEHLLTFVAGLVVTATLLMAVAAGFAPVGTEDGLTMWTDVVVPQIGDIAGALVYVMLFVTLLTTEYAIVESFVRNSADIVYELHGREAGWSLPRLFWTLLTLFVAWGIALLVLPLSIEDPFGLLVVGAALAGLMMWPYSGLLAVGNATRLPEHTQPGWVRLATLWWATAFFGYFSVLLAGNWLENLAGLPVFRAEPGVLGSEPGGYLLFVVATVAQVAVVALSIRGKRRAQGSVEGAEEARGPLY